MLIANTILQCGTAHTVDVTELLRDAPSVDDNNRFVQVQ